MQALVDRSARSPAGTPFPAVDGPDAAERRGEAGTDLMVLIAGMLIGFVAAIVLVSTLLFFAGVAISWFQVPVAVVLTAGLGWWVATRSALPAPGRALAAAAIVCAAAFLSFFAVSHLLHDVSWDGQTYHAEAIVQLAEGWNPVAGPRAADADYAVELNYFAKGSWIASAALFRTTGSFEGGKAFHLTLMLACLLLWAAALSTFPGIPRGWRWGLSALVAFNPVSSYQMFTYYVDGQLSSLLGIAVALLLLADRRSDRSSMLLLALVIILAINVKLTGALYIAIITVGFWSWRYAVRRPHTFALGAWIVGGGAVGALIAGYNPYVSQFLHQLIATGNPFHPHPDWRSLISLESSWIFPGRTAAQQLFVSLAAASQVDAGSSIRLKVPFTFSVHEIRQFAFPDVRVGGFGPLFGGALLLALTALGTILLKCRDRLRDSAAVLVLAGLSAASVLAFSEAWWARLAPQMALVPLLVAVAGLSAVARGPVRALILAIPAALLINGVLITAPYAAFSVTQSVRTDQLLHTLQADGGEIPIVNLRGFPGIRYRLERAGIRYQEVGSLPCGAAERAAISMTDVETCRPA